MVLDRSIYVYVSVSGMKNERSGEAFGECTGNEPKSIESSTDDAPIVALGAS